MSKKQPTVAVIFGGKSAEHDVSIITAHTPIIASLKASGQYQVVPIYITKAGKWCTDEAMLDIGYFQGTDCEEKVARLPSLQITLGERLVFSTSGWRGNTFTPDIIFPAMHGTYGEDGSLMGVLRMANVPFVGCDMAASAVAMDKVLTKQVTQAAGVPVTKYVWFTRHGWEQGQDNYQAAIAALNYPLFVKPVHLGSSIAITRVDTPSELIDAIELALHYDEKILVEEGVTDLTEVTLPIMGNDELTLASIERPLNDSNFFNFEDKYLGQAKKGGEGANRNYSEIPAQLSDTLTATVKDVAVTTYRTLGCAGTARIDMLIDNATDTVYLNEVNTLPGSLYHHNWKQSGVSNLELVTELIDLAQKRHQSQQTTTHTFASSVLQQAGRGKKG